MLEFFNYSTHKPESKEQLLALPLFRDRFGEKVYGLCSYYPSAEEVGGVDVSLYEAAQNFEIFSNMQDQS
jgi:hypothetical protein